MVGTVEQELRAAGNGAKSANDQFFVIDGIMIQDIVFFNCRGSLTKSL